jgi:signal transduction histidine kinase
LPRADAFISSYLGVFCVNELLTAALLFSQASIAHSRALLVLAAGYLFAALIAASQALAFSRVFSASVPWIYFFWHLGVPSALLAYAWLKDRQQAPYALRAPSRSSICWSITLVIALVCGLTWLAARPELLPALFSDSTNMTPWVFRIGLLANLLNLLAFASLWMRRRSVLDQWLLVVLLALIFESMLLTIFQRAPFSFGFYAGRIFSLITSVTVLVVLIAETMKLDARLARSNMMLQRERDDKLMSMAAMAASISHEVRQPLMAIAMSSGAALQFLSRSPPALEETRSALNTIVGDSHRASQIFDGIGSLFKGTDQHEESIDMNDVVVAALRTLQGDIDEHSVVTDAELAPALARVIGHRGQLQEVIINLAKNAIEAMDSVDGRARILRLRTECIGLEEIAVTVEDSGPGIDPTNLPNLFDAFITSKPHGMGLGLAICRMIIDQHGGQISAWSNDEQKGGAFFRFTLPAAQACR